eukprot:gene771-1086_t
MTTPTPQDPLVLYGQTFASRLLLGTSRYPSPAVLEAAVKLAKPAMLTASLRRQGVTPTKLKKRRMRSGQKIRPKDLAIFTRQLATMMKAGVPLLQAFDIVGRGNANAS